MTDLKNASGVTLGLDIFSCVVITTRYKCLYMLCLNSYRLIYQDVRTCYHPHYIVHSALQSQEAVGSNCLTVLEKAVIS